ncbi:MAG: hypothetical protein Q9227_006118, partial [Pyrenula ochraceoflavens]
AELEAKLDDMDDELASNEDAEGAITPTASHNEAPTDEAEDASFMSESIYGKLSSDSPKAKRPKRSRRKSMPILHEHLEPGSQIKTLPAHNDTITALDFDIPFGTMVTAALDDTVRVWDLSAGRCIGFLEGHTASVRCLQVEDNIVATGSSDASIRLWDLSRAKYDPYATPEPDKSSTTDEEDDGLSYGNDDEDHSPPTPPPSSLSDCPLFSLEAHVDSITALHFRNDTLVSGSADKTLRQWDLTNGRCVQTLDVLWAAAQASSTIGTNTSSSSSWRPSVKNRGGGDMDADFVGALQCFDAALACGTADGMVRLWDLRSGQVHRSLVGHTGPVTCLQFDEVHLVTGSADRSIRKFAIQIWDLRTGGIFDAYAYEQPVTSMMFDSRRIVAAAGEDLVKIYDKAESRQWDCGPGDNRSVVERVAVKDGYLVEGRRDGGVGVWSC